MHDRLSIIACQKLKVKQKLATWIQWVTVCINLCQLMLWAWVFWPNGVYRRPGNHKLLFTKYRKWIWRAAYIIVRYCIEIALEGTRLLGLHQRKQIQQESLLVGWQVDHTYDLSCFWSGTTVNKRGNAWKKLSVVTGNDSRTTEDKIFKCKAPKKSFLLKEDFKN